MDRPQSPRCREDIERPRRSYGTTLMLPETARWPRSGSREDSIFSAAHRLFRRDWSDERNAHVFGDCSHENWHGHNYELEVTVAGVVDSEAGFVMDLKTLRDLVQQHVVNDVDHRNLNLDVPWMEGVLPSTENVVVAVWNRLVDVLPAGVRLERVLL